MDQFSKLAVKLIIVALTTLASVAPASGGVFFFENNSGITIQRFRHSDTLPLYHQCVGRDRHRNPRGRGAN